MQRNRVLQNSTVQQRTRSEASHQETDHGSTEGRDSLFEAEKRESNARQGYQESSRRDDGQHLWTQYPKMTEMTPERRFPARATLYASRKLDEEKTKQTSRK